jgi:hypothetical protein
MTSVSNKHDGDNDVDRWKEFAPDWDHWGKFPRATLSDAVALLCNFDPEVMRGVSYARAKFEEAKAEQSDSLSIDASYAMEMATRALPGDLVDLFVKRLAIAESHVEDRTLTTDGGRVRLVDFGQWAEGVGWSLPNGFPRPPRAPAIVVQAAGGGQSGHSASMAAGVPVYLPHLTKTLEALFKVMREHWTTYDSRNPPKSTVVASDIDAALGWKAQKGGEPSRSAQSLAAAIRPDELSEDDARNRKRTRGPS